MKLLSLILVPLIANANLSLTTTKDIDLKRNEIENIKAITIETIKQNPRLIAQQISNYQQKKITEEQTLDLERIKRYKNQIIDKNVISYGNDNADIIIVEFIDYNCNHCKQLINNIKKLTFSQKNIKVVVKDLPVLGVSSENAAKAAIAASQQDQYLKYQEQLISAENPYSLESLTEIAGILKMDKQKFIADYNSPETMTEINANKVLAKNLMITATPSIVVVNKNLTFGKIIPGSLNTEQLKAVLQIKQP